MAVVLAAMTVAACGKSAPQPAPVQQLLSAAAPSGAGTWRSVLTATGQGTRRFPNFTVPRTLQVELNCRGGHTVDVRVGGRLLLTGWCGPMIPGASGSEGRARGLTVVASPRTRWSLAVVAIHRR